MKNYLANCLEWNILAYVHVQMCVYVLKQAIEANPCLGCVLIYICYTYMVKWSASIVQQWLMYYFSEGHKTGICMHP